MTSLMPVIVLAISGADASAYIYLASTIAYTLYLINLNVGMSLITEGARDPERIVEYTRKALRHGAQIVVPLSLLLVLAAPVALRFFGTTYASHGTLLLQLLALSAIPNLIVAIYVSAARARRQMRVVFITVSATSAAVLALSIVLLKVMGLNGVGVGWLIAESAAAAVILLTGLRSLWAPRAMIRGCAPHDSDRSTASAA
jgi:O-antigen/teichoic acid export membrane protein